MVDVPPKDERAGAAEESGNTPGRRRPEATQVERDNAALRAQLLEASRSLQQSREDNAECMEQVRRLSLLQELGHALSRATSEQALFRHTSHYLRAMFPAVARVSMTLESPKDSRLRVYASSGLDDIVSKGSVLSENSSVGWVYHNRRLLFLQGDELNNTPINRKLLARDIRAIIVAPLMVADNCIGTLNLAASKMSGLSGDDRGLFTRVAEIVAQSCDRWRLLDSLQNALREAREKADKLVKAKERADAANTAKSKFLSSVSHELRTPLNAVLGFADLLERSDSFDAQNREYLDAIRSSGVHLLGLIDGILELSKVEAGDEVSERSAVDMSAECEHLRQIFAPEVRTKGITLLVACSPDIPPVIELDASKLRSVLKNLVADAVQNTEAGAVEVRIAADDDLLRVTVEDCRPAISDAELQQFLEPFVRTGADLSPGDGPELRQAIVKRNIDLMRGKISVGRRDPHGVVFTFALPVRIPVTSRVAPTDTRRRVVGLDLESPRPRLLVVDDNRLNRRVLMTLLRSAGFEVRGAENGQEAIDIWRAWAPGLIWMDIQMPVLDGREATRMIRDLEGQRETVIVALTASAFEEDRRAALASGCDEFMPKPFVAERVFDCLKRWLNVRYCYANE